MTHAQTETDPSDAPKIFLLGDGTVVRQAVDNMGWVDLGREGTLVVDALEQPELEGEVFKALAETADNHVAWVLNTHCHYDHVALNAAFEARFGAKIVNQRTAIIPPEGRWIEGTDHRVQMLPCPDCHTPEDCVVWVPSDSVLFVGDIFGWGLIPWDGNLRPNKQAQIVETYKKLIEFDAAHVVPGHGPLCSTAELKRWLEYFTWLRERVRDLVAQGRSRQAIRDALPPPDDMKGWWRFVEWKHEDSLKKVVKAGEKGWLQ